MGRPNSCDERELVLERILRVENALYRLKLLSISLPSGDDGEVEQLERLARELRERYEEPWLQSAGERRGRGAVAS
jgi:hypothetical protein